MKEITFKKTHPSLSFILTNLTFGAYVPYWFLSRRDSIEQLGKVELHFKLLRMFFVLYIGLAFYYIIGGAFFTEEGAAFIDTMNIWVSFIGLGITYYSVFRVAEAIEKNMDAKMFNRWLLVLFHIWYLQYKINKNF